MILRNAYPSDFEKAVSLEKKLFSLEAVSRSQHKIAPFFTEFPQNTVVLVKEDSLIGFGCLYPFNFYGSRQTFLSFDKAPILELGRVAIDPDYQNKMCGVKIVTELEKQVSHSDCVALYSRCTTDHIISQRISRAHQGHATGICVNICDSYSLKSPINTPFHTVLYFRQEKIIQPSIANLTLYSNDTTAGFIDSLFSQSLRQPHTLVIGDSDTSLISFDDFKISKLSSGGYITVLNLGSLKAPSMIEFLRTNYFFPTGVLPFFDVINNSEIGIQFQHGLVMQHFGKNQEVGLEYLHINEKDPELFSLKQYILEVNK